MFRDKARVEMQKWATHDRQAMLSAESRSRFEKARQNPVLFKDTVQLRGALLDFIADFANWDNSTVKEFLNTSRALTQAAHEALGGAPGTKPLVVDPFAGGGSIPLEALRVGADAFASDLNPVPVLLNKVVLEYIPKYGQRLADEVRKWGEWVKKEAEKELAEFYPKDSDGATPIAYLWARTIQCEGPGCGAEVPLIRSLWLSKRQSIGLEMKPQRKRLEFQLKHRATEKNLQSGTVKRGTVTCPCCGFTTSRQHVEHQIKKREVQPTLLAVVLEGVGSGKKYRLPTENDRKAIARAKTKVESRDLHAWIPNEDLPYLRSIFNVHIYGINKWNLLFDARQKLALATLTRIVSRLSKQLAESGSNTAQAVAVCLALAVDRLADFNSNIARWANHRETSAATFGRQALGMVWDYCETVPLSNSTGSLLGSVDWICRVCEALASVSLSKGHAEQASAAAHPLPDDSASILFTDPPYYDAVPYANLADFFYVWLKRSLRNVLPDLFKDDETPKNGEAVQLAERNPIYGYKTKEYFEHLMLDSFRHSRRYVQPNGLGVIVFAHKSTSAWETLLSAVINARWIITASWPIDTEMGNRLRAMDSAALASSVHLVCRPRENPDGSIRIDEVGDWRDVLTALPGRIHEWMPRLAEEGVVGADAIFACLGPALEIFSRYSRVEKASGEAVTLKEYLEQVWAAVAKEALTLIFTGADATGFEEDARLTAMWLWTLRTDETGADSEGSDEEGGAVDEEDDGKSKPKTKGGFTLEYDAARKIAQGLGAHLEELKHLVDVHGEIAVLLPVAARTRYLFGKESAEVPRGRPKKKEKQLTLNFEGELKQIEEESADWTGELKGKSGRTVLDQLHQSMILFAAGRSEALKRFLVEDGIGRKPLFWRLAQALSALYPTGTDEKRWVDGVLARKKGLGL
jgi:adenine-specific DNA methylase